MSSNMRELTDGELDSVGGGRHHHHHHHDRWTGGGSSGGGLTGFLGTTNIFIIFINIGNTVGAQIGQQVNGLLSLNGAGVQLGSLGLSRNFSAYSVPPKKLHERTEYGPSDGVNGATSEAFNARIEARRFAQYSANPTALAVAAMADTLCRWEP